MRTARRDATSVHRCRRLAHAASSAVSCEATISWYVSRWSSRSWWASRPTITPSSSTMIWSAWRMVDTRWAKQYGHRWPCRCRLVQLVLLGDLAGQRWRFRLELKRRAVDVFTRTEIGVDPDSGHELDDLRLGQDAHDSRRSLRRILDDLPGLLVWRDLDRGHLLAPADIQPARGRGRPGDRRSIGGFFTAIVSLRDG